MNLESSQVVRGDDAPLPLRRQGTLEINLESIEQKCDSILVEVGLFKGPHGCWSTYFGHGASFDTAVVLEVVLNGSTRQKM